MPSGGVLSDSLFLPSEPSGGDRSMVFDFAGSELAPDATSAKYQLSDENGVVLVPFTTIDSYSAGDAEVTVVIGAGFNVLPFGVQIGGREVIVRLSDGSKYEDFRQVYRVVSGTRLQVPTNSFVTLTMAEMLVDEIPSMRNWLTYGTDLTRTNALLAAHQLIVNLRLREIGSSGRDRAGYGMTGVGNVFCIADLSSTEWDSLDEALKRAVRLAQVAQADAFLDPQFGESQNLRSIVIGESSRTYFQTTRSRLAPPAMRYLSRYLAPAGIARG